jgi:hypothetical protein
VRATAVHGGVWCHGVSLRSPLQDAEERAPRPIRGADSPTVDDAADSLRERLTVSAARRSYLECCESMQRVHITPRLGSRAVTEVTSAYVQALAGAMLRAGRSPKTVRNVLSFLHSIFEHAIDKSWTRENPVRRAVRPGRRRARPPVPHAG